MPRRGKGKGKSKAPQGQAEDFASAASSASPVVCQEDAVAGTDTSAAGLLSSEGATEAQALSEEGEGPEGRESVVVATRDIVVAEVPNAQVPAEVDQRACSEGGESEGQAEKAIPVVTGGVHEMEEGRAQLEIEDQATLPEVETGAAQAPPPDEAPATEMTEEVVDTLLKADSEHEDLEAAAARTRADRDTAKMQAQGMDAGMDAALTSPSNLSVAPPEQVVPAGERALGYEGRAFDYVASEESFNTDHEEELEVLDDDGEREDDEVGATVWRGVDDETDQEHNEDMLDKDSAEQSHDEIGPLPGEHLSGEQEYLMAALGEVPPEFSIPQPAQRPQWQGDQAFTDLEDAPDMDPSFQDEETETSSEEEQGEGEGEEDEDEDGESVDEEGLGASVVSDQAGPSGRKGAGEANGGLGESDKAKDGDKGQASGKEKEQNNDGALTAIQRSTVSDLFRKKAPERAVDGTRKLPVTFVVVEGDDDLPLYQPCEDASWWPHRSKIEDENKKPGVKGLIVRTETRGPKSAMYTTYVIHVKTAFHVRGVSRRFSDFSTLDRKLKAQYPNAPELVRSNRILGTLSPGFVQERRQHLQEYLDKVLADHQLAHSDTMRQFLALHGIPDIGSLHETKTRDPFAERSWHVGSVNVAGLLQELLQCRSAKDAPRETRLLNKIGLVMCEMDNQGEGLVYLQKSVASARLSNDRRMLLACVSNNACAHLRFGGHAQALELLEEAVEIAQRLGDVSSEAACLRKIALVQACDGDIPTALRYIEEAAELFASEDDVSGAASARFTAGVMKYEMGDTIGGVAALEESLVLRRQVKDKLGIAEALNRLGLALIDIGFHLQALDYFERALSLCQEMGDGWGEAATLRLLGYVHLAQVDGDRSISLDLFRKSLSLSRRNGDVLGQATCREGIADVLMDMDDAKGAIQHYSQALAIREKAMTSFKDPPRLTRHVQLLRSKLSRAKAQMLENSMNQEEGQGSDEEGDGGDFLWRKNGGIGSGSDEEADPGFASTAYDAPLSESNFEFLQQQLASAMTNGAVALTKLWS